MDKERLIAAVDKYAARLYSFTPARLDEESMSKIVVNLTQRVALNHARWMCEEIKRILEDGRVEKAMRWLGFIQGALWMSSFYSLDDLKKDNMPVEAKFDAKRV